MKDYSEIMENSKKIHAQKFNCAQSVICALSDYTELDDAASKAVSAGFGGGLRCGEACGAVTGAVMAMGLAVARDGSGSKDLQLPTRPENSWRNSSLNSIPYAVTSFWRRPKATKNATSLFRIARSLRLPS